MASPVAIYLRTEAGGLFAPFHPADGSVPARVPILICAPWGWDDVASYRTRKAWAERLAAAGHPTLRFDLPGTGNSAGTPADHGLTVRWVGAVDAAARRLCEETGHRSVAAIGLGLGGLLAREAVARGAPITELALWGAPLTGTAFLREVRAFSRLQLWNQTPEVAPAQPVGIAVEAGGFVLGEETFADLKALKPAAAPALRRCLLLGRDGVRIEEELCASLEQAGTEVTAAPVVGWGDFVSHPERSELVPGVVESVFAWLADGTPTAAAAGGEGGPPRVHEQSIEVSGVPVKETAYRLPQGFGDAFCILSEPASAGDAVPGPCLAFLNAGAVRNVGPNRLWVETARRWAARGRRSIRIDLESLGEADGPYGYPDGVSGFYDIRFEDQVRAVLESAEACGFGEDFVLVGLCSGGYLAYRATLATGASPDGSVRGAVLLNAGALAWYDGILTDREVRNLGRAFERRSWRRLREGKIRAAQLGTLANSTVRKVGRRLRRSSADREWRSWRSTRRAVADELDRLGRSGIPLSIALSGREPLRAELEAFGLIERISAWPSLRLVELPGEDHSLRPLDAQTALAQFLDVELTRMLSSAAVGSTVD